MSNEYEKKAPEDSLKYLYWRDEILQLMYWMTGEGFGREFDDSDLRRFLDADVEVLEVALSRMVSEGLLECANDKYSLTELGKSEGGRRFADEFDPMLKPGHFECDQPDCDCHNPESEGEACKHLFPVGPTRV
jgi:hypothetical protein